MTKIKSDSKALPPVFPGSSSKSSSKKENDDANSVMTEQKAIKNARGTIGQVSSGAYCHARGFGFGLAHINTKELQRCAQEQKNVRESLGLEIKALPVDCQNHKFDPVMVWVRNTTSFRYTPAFVNVIE